MPAPQIAVQSPAQQPSSPAFFPISERAYEDLLGGTGREVFYRQERTDVATLLEGCLDLVHEVRLGTQRGTLTNYTVNGLAFSLPASSSVSEDEVLEELRVIVGDETVYHGSALVRYSRLQDNVRLVGVALLDGCLDPDQILIAKSRSTATSTFSSISNAWSAEIDPEYKKAIADAVFLMNSYRALLERQERSLQRATPSEARARGEREVLDSVEARFGQQYEGLRQTFNRQTADLLPATRVAYKRYTEAMLHPAVLCAPAAHHCYDKPLGYPGDYMLMSHLYSDERRGDSLYAKLIHQVVVRDEPLANAVRCRKDFMLSQIHKAANAAGRNHERAKIMSLGCGPAQEVVEFVGSAQFSDVDFTLVDQDQRSLAYVFGKLSRVVSHRVPRPVKYLYLGFKQLLTRNEVIDSTESQDLIYTAGLFDYLSKRIAQRLALRLYQRLRAGGVLAIGNFRAGNGATWSLDYWMDWPLIYRTRSEMLEIAALIEPACEREVAIDTSGYTHVLLLRKP